MATKTSAKRQQELELEVEYLKTRLKETIDAFTAIRQGEVDAFVVSSPQGAQVYILEGIERRYRAIVETMNVAALILSTDGTILYCNSQFAQMLDLNLTQVMGGSLQNLIAKADRERCAAFLRECVQWRSKVDLGLVGSAGKQIMAELSGSPLQLEDSTGVCLVVTDITERKRAEAALRQNERKLRLITENLRDTVFAYDMNHQLIFVNSNFEILTGYTIGELYARNFINYLHPDDATRIMSLWEDVFQGKAFAGEEFRIVRKDGQIRWCASSWSPLIDEQGQQIGIQGREADITERKRAEVALRESEEKYRTLVENIPGSEFRCEATPPRRVIHQSTEIENLSGYLPSNFLDGSILFDDIELPEDVEKVNQAIESAIADKKSYVIEYRLRHADGSIHWVSERGHVTYSEQGEPLWIDGIIFDITEQKQIEKALRENEIRYRELFDNISSGVAIYDVKGDGEDFIFKDFNKAGERIDSDRKEDIIGKSIFEARPGIKEFGLLEVFKRVWLTGLPEHFPLGIYQDNRISGWYENYVYRLPSGEIVAVFDNVTERKQTEAALRESEERFRTLFEQAAVGVALLETKTGRYVSINQRYCDLLGYTKEEMLGRPFQDVTYPEDIQKYVDHNTLLIKEKIKEYSIEKRYICKDGTVVWGRLTVSPLWGPGEKPDTYFHIAVVEDITERQRAEYTLRESEMKVKTLIELLPVGVSILNAENKLIYTNPTLERILGLSREGLMRGDYRGRRYLRPDGSLSSPEEYASQRAIKEQKVISGVEIGVEKEDGNIVWTSVSAVPVSLSDWRVVIVTADITERKQAETEREILLKQLNTAQSELRSLAAYLQTALEDERTLIAREIHDEFGQHLTALKMDLAWLSTHIKPAEPQVQEKMAVMTSMLQELIQYARQVASNLRPGLLDDLGLNAAIEWYANDWSARHGKGIFIHLPDRELPLNREMSTTLYRILQETLTNVARHAEATRVYVYLEMADNHVILKVRDNGRGISQKEIHSSTALGLLGMRERAYQFGGGLEISAKPGRGTTVQVRLPLKQGT